MIGPGEKALLLTLHGRYKGRLVPVTVRRLWPSGVATGTIVSERGENKTFALRDDEEGITWCKGHDVDSPQASALRVTDALS